MVTHFLTLRALAGELDALFRSLRIAGIFTQQKNEMIVSAESAHAGPQGEREAPSIHISVDPQENYLFASDATSRARRNSVDIFVEVAGSVIGGVSIVPYDRTVRIDLDDGRLIFMQLYGSAASNVYLTDPQLKVLNAFKNRKRLEGSLLLAHESRFDPDLLDDAGMFTAAVRTSSSATTFQALKSTLPILGSTYAREALFRAEIDAHGPAGELSDAAVDRLHAGVREILAAPVRGGATIYSPSDAPPVFSAIPLHHLATEEHRGFESVSEGVKSFIGRASRSRTFHTEKNELLDSIKKELDRTRRSLEAAGAGSRESLRADEYERMGRLVMENLRRVEEGADRIVVSVPAAAGREASSLAIALNPALTPARNAQEYFGKAKKARVAETETVGRLRRLKSKGEVLGELLGELESAADMDQVTAIRKKHARLTKTNVTPVRGADDSPLPFRTFEVAGGFKVLTGKSSAGNDLLTTRYAKPNDLWFHARGASGSHTVLKVEKGQHVPKEAIRAAAAIAAYYSKMRNASNVPVAYCERKYVHKPRGAPPGTVTLEREEIVFVNPRLP